jgi:hypothetical protein
VSHVLIQQYLNQLQDLRKVSGTHRESVVREAFKDLLKGWARQHDLVFVPEYEITTPAKDRRYVDGALLHALRMPFGYWEAKDEKDDLDAEIEFKLRRGYPQDNIIFEDSTQAVLIQSKREVMRCPVDDVAKLEKLLNLFFGYERAEVSEFRKAVEQFKTDLPAVLQALREMIEQAFRENVEFRTASQRFLDHAKETINPSLTEADVREMLIQHVLTEEIFSKVFGEDDFHHQNNVAKELYALRELSSLAISKSAPCAVSIPTMPPSVPPRPKSAATTRNRPSSRSSTKISTRSITRRPLTDWAWSIRPMRSSVS